MGKLVCGTCGHALTFTGSKYTCRYGYTSASGRCFPQPIKKNELESAIITALQVQLDIFIEKDRLIEQSRINNKITISAVNAQIRLFSRQLDKLKSNRCSIYEKYADESISKEDYLSQRDTCDSQITAVSDKLDELIQAKKTAERPMENSMLKSLMAVKTEDGQLNKQVFDALVKKIVVYDANRIEIVWNTCNELEPSH